MTAIKSEKIPPLFFIGPTTRETIDILNAATDALRIAQEVEPKSDSSIDMAALQSAAAKRLKIMIEAAESLETRIESVA